MYIIPAGLNILFVFSVMFITILLELKEKVGKFIYTSSEKPNMVFPGF